MPKRKRDQGADLFTMRCCECNRYLVMTESGFFVCPRGHGKLIVDSYNVHDPAETFSMFPDELEEAT